MSASKNFSPFFFAENRVYNLTLFGLTILELFLFKLAYPYPDFFSDSYSYIAAARDQLDVNIWPIGYSRFLAFFHLLSHSGSLLVWFQYLSFFGAALYFYHTITYLYQPGKSTRTFLCLFLFFNPLFFYLANYVTSDILFISMSTLWLTQLIWLVHRPRIYQGFILSVLVFVMFTFRYNALIYPFITAGAFLVSKQKGWIKALGIVLGPLFILPFIIWSSHAAKEITGTAQFPPILGGWQWGNNALYMRGFIKEDSSAFPTVATAELDSIARRYFNQPSSPQDQLADYVANFFIREPEAPLKQYLDLHFHAKTNREEVVAWGKAATVFDQYGKYLIRRHPLAFCRYYLLVNSKNYFLPPLEKLEIYNLGSTRMWKTGQKWFDYQNPNMWCISNTLQGFLLAPFQYFFLALNIYYIIVLSLFIRRRGFRRILPSIRYAMLLVTLFLVLNAAFSIFANIIVIRYQIFPMLVFFTFAMLLTDLLERFSTEPQKSTPQSAFTHVL